MPKSYQNPRYPFRHSPDQDTSTPVHHPIVIVGAGLVGLTAAVDFATRGVRTLVLDDDDTVSFGSRAICFAKRSVEICDRLGIAEAMRAKGVTWNLGKVFLRDRLVYEFNMLPDEGHDWPAFINLQQYYAEEWLVERAEALGQTEIRWESKVVGVEQDGDKATLLIETQDDQYQVTCDYLLACDGARSLIRQAMDLEFKGKVFEDRFLISDVVMKADYPTERWFWFDPPFHPEQSALLHRQADNVWRIDLQLGWNTDPEEERQPDRVMPRLKAMLGEDKEFDLDWVSVYTFQCRRLDKFRHGRIFFVGDSAHQVSPFGARGGNGGMQDADNLAWKLQLVLDGRAPDALLDSYDEERIVAADENILNSTRSTDFITPKNKASRAYRDAVLELAERFSFARALVNSGRLSVPCVLSHSSLNTPDEEPFAGTMQPGAPAVDAPVLRDGTADWLLHSLGPDFTLLLFAQAGQPLPGEALQALENDDVPIRPLVVARDAFDTSGPPLLVDSKGFVAARYDGRPGTCYLFRPDQHVTARFRDFDAMAVRAARDRALCRATAALPERRAVGQ